MAFDVEKRQAAHLLRALEDGGMDAAVIRSLYEEADPALVALLIAWLRNRYHAGHSASEGVLGRIVALFTASSTVKRMAREGQSDMIVQWFEENHGYSEFDRDDFVDLIVEKLES
jgi:hypothetical protein